MVGGWAAGWAVNQLIGSVAVDWVGAFPPPSCPPGFPKPAFPLSFFRPGFPHRYPPPPPPPRATHTHWFPPAVPHPALPSASPPLLPPPPAEGDCLDVLRDVDEVFISCMREWGLYDKIWQAFAVFLPIKSVGE